MILHRLTLTNVKGIDHAEIDFSDGVTIISGPNEAGKSTIIEAFDILLKSKATSTASDVRALSPVGRDVDPQIGAEMTIGGTRITYTKKYAKGRGSTTLTYGSGPRVGETLTGDAAHDAARQLWSGVDQALWNASRLMQATGLDQKELSGSAALRNALDGQSVQDATPLIEKVADIVGVYYTPTRAEGKVLKEADKEVADLEEAARVATEALVSLDKDLATLADLQDTSAKRAASLAEAKRDLDELTEAAAAVETVHAALDTATAAAERQRSVREAAAGALQRRTTLIDEARHDEETAAASAAELEQAEAEAAPAQQKLAEAIEAASQAKAAHRAARGELEAAERLERAHRARAEADELADTLDKADELTVEIRTLQESRSGVDPDLVASLVDISNRIAVATDVLRDSATELQIETGSEILFNGETITGSWSGPITEVTRLSVGDTSLTLTPSIPADLEELRGERDQVLTDLGLASVAEAKAALSGDEKIDRDIETLTARKETLLPDEGAARARFAQLGDVPVPDGELPDIDELRARLATLREAEESALASVDGLRQAQEVTTEARLTLRGSATAHAQQAADSAERLAAERADTPDEELTEAATRAEAELKEAERAVAAARTKVEQLGGTDVLQRRDLARKLVDGLTEQVAIVERDLIRINTILEEKNRVEIQERAEASVAEAERAREDRDHLRAKAGAAKLLEETLLRHRDAAHRKYVAPFKDRLDTYAEAFFATPTSVTVSDDLTITDVHREGQLIPFEQLSTGTREQFAILTRLATASLVTGEDAVPVMLDDALGYSDERRLPRLVSILDQVRSGQVMIFTANPERFAPLSDVTTVSL